MLCADIPGEFLLEGGNLGTHDVLAMIQYGFDVSVDFFPNSFLLEGKVDKFHKWHPV